MLKRKFYDSLIKWKSSHNQECLLVKGARQIGKTFIIRKFGHENYESFIEINFVEERTRAQVEKCGRRDSRSSVGKIAS